MKKISVVIPVYNEHRTVSEIIARVQDLNLAAVEKEIIVIDDFSNDSTREELKRINSNGGNIKILYHDKNMGKGAALRTGFAAVSGDYVIIQDADLEYDPQDYPLLMQPLLEDRADVVYGSRFLGNKPHRTIYFWHFFGNRFLTLFSNILTNLNLTDIEVCYKAFKSDLLKKIILKENGFGFESEFTARISRLKLRIYEVGISYYGRTYEEGKKIGWMDGLWSFWCIVKYNLFCR